MNDVCNSPKSHCSRRQKAKPAARDYDLSDGAGLLLCVTTAGKKIWRLRYQRPGSTSRTRISLGCYPAMSLAEARAVHDEYLDMLAHGRDPQKPAHEKAQLAQRAEMMAWW